MTLPVASRKPALDCMIQTLKVQVRGEVLQPGDAGNDAVRAVCNGILDSRPRFIAGRTQVQNAR